MTTANPNDLKWAREAVDRLFRVHGHEDAKYGYCIATTAFFFAIQAALAEAIERGNKTNCDHLLDLPYRQLLENNRLLSEEILEQCRLNGMGSQREAQLKSENDQLRDQLNHRDHDIEKLQENSVINELSQKSQTLSIALETVLNRDFKIIELNERIRILEGQLKDFQEGAPI